MELARHEARAQDAGGATFAGRYRLTALLKSGNGVDTHRAVDIGTGRDVVVKTIEPSVVHAAARLRFEHETHVLETLSGSGVTGLVDSGFADGRLFLVQAYVPGRTLEQVLRDGPLPAVSTVRVGVDLAAALELAHAAGVCHRDVKPANVILGDPPDAAATHLIDFGFARTPQLDASIRDDLVGTVRYLAPEAAGLLNAPADERSDLYSLGMLLFECVSGRSPFPGPSVGDVLRQHLSMPVPGLASCGVAAPRALEAILHRLLRKDPAERYQSAGALGADLAELLRLLELGDPDPRLVIGRLDHRRSLTDGAFVGREAELDQLAGFAGSLAAGDGGVLLLEADSGGGKSRLLTEAGRQVRQQGVIVLSGLGVAQAAQRPFTLLHGVARDLVALAGSDPDAGERIRDGAADVADDLVRALPSLSGLLSVAPRDDAAPEQFGEQRSLSALRQLLGCLATADRPVLLVLDDCQWADALTVRLLADVATRPISHLGVLAAFRSEEVGPNHPLRAVPAAERLRLGPLSDASIALLAQSMAGPLPAPALEAVARLSDGSPFMASAVLRGLVEGGALVAGADGWQFHPAAPGAVQTGRRSAPFLVNRLEMLPPAALDLLSAGAVLGKEFDIELAVDLAGTEGASAAVFEEARRRRLLWVDDRTGRCSFAHDKIREALLERLGHSPRRELHARAARALCDRGAGTAFELAYHLDAAGECQAALPHALAAAEASREQHALDAALAHYRMAQRGAQSADRGTRLRISEGLGDVLTLQGSYEEARAELTAARALTDRPLHAAELEGKLGDLAFKQGEIADAKRHLEGAMNRLGRRVPTSPRVLLIRLLWELAVQAAHTLLPGVFVGRRPAQQQPTDALAMRLYSRLAYLYWFHSGKVSCAWAHLRGMNLAERYPPSAELAQAYSEHAPVMTMLPWFSRGVRYAQRSLQIRRERQDLWGQGQSLGFIGVVLYAAGRYRDAMDACREAIRLLERTGDRWEANTAGWHVALCQHRLGELPEAAATAQEVLAAATAIGDAASAGISLSVWARARPAAVDGALVAAHLAKGSDDAHTATELRLAAALVNMAQGEPAAAVADLRAAIGVVRRAGLRQEYVAPVFPWYATALRRLAEATPAHQPAERRRRIRRARRAARRARRWSAAYRNNAPHALREAALVASLAGRRRRAAVLLRRSTAVAEAQGARYEAALSRLALHELGGDAAHCDEERAVITALEGGPVPGSEAEQAPTLSLFDRFTTLLGVGRTITAAASPAAVETAIRDAALTLLRGERCHVISTAALAAEPLLTMSGEAVDALSRSLLTRAVERGEPVVAGDTSEDCDSVLLSGVRSVLAAPIMVDGEAVACFYVTHREVGQLFGDEEVQLAAFITALAGAAFEHLAGNETRFRSLAQNSSDVITLLDRECVITYQSPAAARVFALPPGALLGEPIRSWVHPADLERFTSSLTSALEARSCRIECRFRHADGSYRYAETAVTNLLDEPTVGALVLNTRDITERRRLEDELRNRALHDSLTGLPNRALFLDRAVQGLERSRRRLAPLVVAFLDLDDFKAVNDTFGHGAGDALLGKVSDRLLSCLRPTDTLARFGGDEFALLLEETDLATAVTVVERILARTAEPISLAETDVVVHTSVGITVCEDPATKPDELLSQADAAMYAAKARGKDCYEVFVPAMRSAIETRSRVRAQLESALSRGELTLHYQPMIELAGGTAVGAEALIRWNHPERGLLAPAEFIDRAEESDQIVSIGSWVLATACRDATRFGPRAHMSVNVSARQLQQADLASVVEAALGASGLRPEQLILEITETAAVTDIRSASAKLRELKELGVRIALDDFGTGYAPLSYLRHFPVDFLKIDRSFVHSLATSRQDTAIVRAVVEMSHALGLEVVAEGVEDEAQLGLLRGLGCDLGQGYFWQQPLPLEQAVDTVLNGHRNARLPRPRRAAHWDESGPVSRPAAARPGRR